MHRHMQLTRFIGFAFSAFLVVVAPVLHSEVPDEYEQIAPSSEFTRIGSIIIDQIRASHLLGHKSIDDEASSAIFDAYLETLDPSRLYFHQSDIDEFERYRFRLDEAVRQGDLEPAYLIFNRAQERQWARAKWILERVEAGTDSFDLNTDAKLEIDRHEAPFIADSATGDKLWEERLTASIIESQLNGQPDEDLQKILTQRYERQLRSISQIKPQDVFDLYINTVAAYYDPHTLYLSPRDADAFNTNMSLTMEGIGALLRSTDDYVTVIELVPGGPAATEGSLKPLDRIVGVGQGDGEPVVDVIGWRLDDVVDIIKGPKGTVVNLYVKKEDKLDGLPTEIKLTRDTIKLENSAAKSETIEFEHNGNQHKLGVIDLPAMYRDFARANRGNDFKSSSMDVAKLIEGLKKEGVEGIILDLRRNGGGALDEAVSLVGLFIEKGPVVQVKGRSRRTAVLRDLDASVAWDGPLLILVSQRSASASEILAGAIQDYGRGIVVGHQTFGKGTVQTLAPLPHGQLKVTNAKYYRINGESTQVRGVIPDLTMPGGYNASSFGEAAMDGALPWDQIRATAYSKFEATSEIDDIIEAHDSRIADDPYFQFNQKYIDRRNEIQEREFLSLNIEDRLAEREENEIWELTIGNDLLAALGEETAEDNEALEEKLEEVLESEDANKRTLLEAGRILMDYAGAETTSAIAAASAIDMSTDQTQIETQPPYSDADSTILE